MTYTQQSEDALNVVRQLRVGSVPAGGVRRCGTAGRRAFEGIGGKGRFGSQHVLSKAGYIAKPPLVPRGVCSACRPMGPAR